METQAGLKSSDMALDKDHFNDMGEWMSPTVEFNNIVLHYGNTKLRFFSDRFAFMNHLEYRNEEGELGGFVVPKELTDALMDKEFPYAFDFYPTKSDIEWYLRDELSRIEAI